MKKALKLCFFIGGVFILLEVFLHIAFQDKLGLRKMPLIYQPDSIIGYKYVPNTPAVIKSPSIYKEFRINNQGFVGNDFLVKKANGTFRILFVGSSEVSGIFSNGPDSYSTLLQEMFDSVDANVEVINCAIDGQGRYFMDHYNIENLLINYNPDLILLERPSFPFEHAFVHRKVYRDYVIYYVDESRVGELEKHIDVNFYDSNFFTSMYSLSYTFRYFCKLYSEQDNRFVDEIAGWLSLDKVTIDHFIKKRVFDGDKREITSMQTSIDSLISLHKFLEAKKINFALYSTYFSDDNLLLKTLFGQLNINSIDLNIPYQPGYTLEKDGHSSQAGHKVIAQRFYSELNKNFLATINNTVVFSKQTSGESIDRVRKDEESFEDITNLVAAKGNGSNSIRTANGTAVYNDDRILILSTKKKFLNDFPWNLTHIILERGDRIKVMFNDSLNNMDLKEYLRCVVQQIDQTNPGIVFVEEPSYEIIASDHSLFFFNSLKEYCHNTGVRFIFYNYFNDQGSAIVQYLLGKASIQYFVSGLDFNAWEWEINDDKRLARLNSLLMAEKFYNFIKDSLVSPGYYSSLRNVALFKPSYASNTLNEWGWHTRSAVDGLRTSYWLSRGFLSLGRLDSISHKEWYLIDLINEFKLEKVSISPAYDVEYIDLPLDFVIKTSRDSLNWQTVLDIRNCPRNGDGVSHFDFEPVDARYIKFEASTLRQNYYYGGKKFYRLSFSEIEVLGRDK